MSSSRWPQAPRLVRAATLAAMLLHGGGAAAAELGADLPALLAHARAQHPELAAMRHEAEAAMQRVQPAGALPDPVLRVELENFNNYGNDRRPNLLPAKVGETRYTLMQAIPWSGKRELRREIAEADAAQARSRVDVAWNELAMKIKLAYAQFLQAAGGERLTREVLDLMSRLEKIAQARYAGGQVAQQDAIRAQLEQTAMRSELIALDAEKQRAQARLNSLLAREPGSALAEPQALRTWPAASALDVGALVQRARLGSPALATEEARLRSLRKMQDLTLRNRYPDFQVGLAPTQMGTRTTAWGLMVEMNIPLQRESRASQEREADSMIQAQRARVQALTSQLLGELGENLAALDAARRSEALVGAQLLPQSELSFRSALAAYESGKVDFATLLDAQRQIRKARQDQLKSQVEAHMRLAEIERIVGEDL